ncbi:MAG: hypothetical protein KF777_21095 [Planctomycetaceae bacterium]|nr:hypothetical protein [Planctomycetaceae bacterium]
MSSESLSTNHVEVEPGRPDSWNVFAGAHRWWLRKGVPPTLGQAGTRVRAIRTSILLAVMGIVSSWVSFGALYLDGFMQGHGGLNVLLGFGPGWAYGIVVLVPLSRWLGRTWFWSIISLLPSCGLYYAALHLHFLISPIFGETSKPPVGALWAGMLGGAGIGLWMARPGGRSLVGLPVACGLVAGVCCSIVFLDGAPLKVGAISGWISDARNLLAFPTIYGSFQVPVAVVLGTRLWGWPKKRSGANDAAK